MTYNSITVQVTAADGQSGIATYTYTINGGSQASTTSASHTFSGLSGSTSYSIQVTVADRAGHVTTETRTISTAENPNVVTKVLKEGDYVYYTDGKGIQRKCVVLWDNTSGYGVQILTMDIVETMSLKDGDLNVSGSNDFAIALNLYNNGISILNSRAKLYNNSAYSSSARCVGSIPNNPDHEEGMWSEENGRLGVYDGKVKIKDSGFATDYYQMEMLGVLRIGEIYWLASRDVWTNAGYYYFYIRTVHNDGIMYVNDDFCAYYYENHREGWGDPDIRYGLRPVFMLIPTVKVVGGSGSSDNPYTLGI